MKVAVLLYMIEEQSLLYINLQACVSYFSRKLTPNQAELYSGETPGLQPGGILLCISVGVNFHYLLSIGR